MSPPDPSHDYNGKSHPDKGPSAERYIREIARLREEVAELTRQMAARSVIESAVAIDSVRLLEAAARERENAETALQAAQRSNEALQSFAAIASHDLREPLRQISTFSQILERLMGPAAEGEAQTCLKFILDGSTRMGRLIEGLLAYSKIEATNPSLSETADCEAALAEALENLVFATTEAEAVITHDQLPVMRGNQPQLGEIFQNLIANALKYRSAEAPRIHITAKFHSPSPELRPNEVRRPKEWIFSVSDNGLGIDAEHRERIFDVFARLHGAQYSGVGLGLAFCKKVVERHGGRIWAEANAAVPSGSVFYFALPA
jgi:light-regulated signal transduction histidine kinase (bacteriophytochrome)